MGKIVKKALTEKFLFGAAFSFVIKGQDAKNHPYKLTVALDFEWIEVRGKGFEPSDELIDKALNLAPLTAWLPPRRKQCVVRVY